MNESASIGFFGLLQILFIGLKLTGHIDWSWFVVFLPTIIPLGFGFVIIMATIIAGILASS